MLQKLKNQVHLLESFAMAKRFGHPGEKLICIGVTGTDGKTTTATLLHHILTNAGIKTCLSSTLLSPHTTTPGRGKIQKFLRQGLKNGCTHAILEVTSIAIDQNRVWGVPFEIGVLTNIANNEHLDYHKTFENYKSAKISFLTECKTIIANSRDPSFEEIVKLRPDALPYGPSNLKSNLFGNFNKFNIGAAIATAKAIGVSEESIRKSVASFKAPSGRLEVVAKKPLVIVDFAHTPQAFEKVLPVVKKLAKGELIHVFGATGDRDKQKRPIMAQVSARFSDHIILTHEDTYSENPQKIISELEAGLKKANYTAYSVSNDRREAIKMALARSKANDVIIITGVGHQKSMNIGGKEIPWSDQQVVKELMKMEKNVH